MIVNIIECDIDFVLVRGLFNLTPKRSRMTIQSYISNIVSVPIRGLFNLTQARTSAYKTVAIGNGFPSPSGDYLI